VNAIEAVEYFELKHPHLIISHRARIHPKERFQKILERFNVEWGSITWFQRPRKFRQKGFPFTLWHRFEDWMRYRQIRRAIRALGESRVGVLGIATLQLVLSLRLLKLVRPVRVVSLDDGTATLSLRKLRQASPDGVPERRPYPWSRESWIQRSLQKIPSVDIFTTYSGPFGPLDRVHPNSFQNLKRLIGEGQVSKNEVWFLGQPLIKGKYVNEEMFVNLMEKVRGHFSGMHLVYILHPREDHCVRSLLLDRSLVDEVRRTDLPIELELAFSESFPMVISGFFTSAFENIAQLFGNQIRICPIRLPTGHLGDRKAFVESVYDRFVNDFNGYIEIINLAEKTKIHEPISIKRKGF